MMCDKNRNSVYIQQKRKPGTVAASWEIVSRVFWLSLNFGLRLSGILSPSGGVESVVHSCTHQLRCHGPYIYFTGLCSKPGGAYI